jgi:hypothetical protein
MAHPAIAKPFDTVAPLAGPSIASRASVTVKVTSSGSVIVRSGVVALTLIVPWCTPPASPDVEATM